MALGLFSPFVLSGHETCGSFRVQARLARFSRFSRVGWGRCGVRRPASGGDACGGEEPGAGGVGGRRGRVGRGARASRAGRAGEWAGRGSRAKNVKLKLSPQSVFTFRAVRARNVRIVWGAGTT